MPGRKFRTLAEDLIGSGIDGATPCVAISKATTPEERVHATTLAKLEDDDVGPAPVILLIGHAVQVVGNVEDTVRAAEELVRL